MSFDLGSMAQGAAEAGINTGLGLLLEKHSDRRQLKQQGKLGQQQLGLNKQQMKYGKELDLQMWENTSYPAQVEQLKKAGLNPGLLYGQSGGGGTTTGGNAGSVNTPNAPQGGGEIIGLQLMGAQKALIEAQTAKTQAETIKTEGVDTKLTKANARIAEIQGQMMSDTYAETFSKILSEAEKAASESRIAAQTADVGQETMQTRIETAEAELVGIGIANELRKTQTNLTQEQIKATVEQVKQKWEEIGVSKDRLKLDQFVKDVADSTKLAVETATKIVGEIVEAVGRGKSAVKMDTTPKTKTTTSSTFKDKHGSATTKHEKWE